MRGGWAAQYNETIMIDKEALGKTMPEQWPDSSER